MRKVGITYAFISAFLFSASAPLSKLLLKDVSPIMLAGLVYFGSGAVLLFIKLIQKKIGLSKSVSSFTGREALYLIGSLLSGGVAAPIILMVSLKSTPAATAALLLNFECVSTVILAFFVFKEEVGGKIWQSVLFITTASIILTIDLNGKWGVSLGALGVISASFLWGIDNNFTKKISEKDPLVIVGIKGLGAGIISIIISQIYNNPIPSVENIFRAVLIGLCCYGLSIIFFVLALRKLGSSRTSIIFGTVPFIGTALSFLILRESVNNNFFISLPLMAYGTDLLLTENFESKNGNANKKL